MLNLKNNRYEHFAPGRGNALHRIADRARLPRRVKHARMEVVTDVETRRKSLLIVFPGPNLAFAIQSKDEIKKWRDAFDAVLDQIQRPYTEEI